MTLSEWERMLFAFMFGALTFGKVMILAKETAPKPIPVVQCTCDEECQWVRRKIREEQKQTAKETAAHE